ncbi:MAG TPA: VOC family protein [Solirubrobacteraceae bacterium]|nr:VOC family protein [Solirubrobacteraceae bacterium]
MAERDAYAPGTFSWVELAAADQRGAKEFYTALFGWDAEDRPVADDVVYSMMSLHGRHVAAIAPQPERQRAAGAPPMWNSFVTVESADAALDRAVELGGSAHAPAFDVFDAGRMAVVQDPQGAYFELWEPRGHRGAGLVNAPGALTWNELRTSDLDGAGAFYAALFGWRGDPFEGSPEPYVSLRNGDADAGGLCALGPREPTPHWLVYFGCADVGEALARAVGLGARKLQDPIEIGVGTVAQLLDPQGAAFALFAGRFDD